MRRRTCRARRSKGTVIVFVCNQCPYVKAVIGRLTANARLLMGEGVGFAAICSNDAASYPGDSFAPDLKLKYRGRRDEARTTPPPPGARRELLEAMRAIAAGGGEARNCRFF